MFILLNVKFICHLVLFNLDAGLTITPSLTDEIIFELLNNRKPSALELKTLRQKP